MNQDRAMNILKKYKEKLNKTKDYDNNTNEGIENIKSLQEKNELIKKSGKEIYHNFKEYCKIKKNNTIININRIKESYRDKKSKIKILCEDYKIFEREEKKFNQLIKISCFTLFFFFNSANFYLKNFKSIYHFRLFRFLTISSVFCLTLNYYAQSIASKYIKNKKKDYFLKAFKDS